MRTHLNHWFKLFTFLLLILPLQLLAEGGPKRSEMDNPMVQVFVLIIAILAFCIVLMARVLLGAAQYKLNQEQEHKKQTAPLPGKAGLLLAGLITGSYTFAAGDDAVVKNDTIGGMGSDTFYMLLIVVIVELIILLALLYNLKFLLRQEKIHIQSEEIR